MVYPISKIFLKPLFQGFIKKVEGLENIPKKGPFILAANHASALDPLVLDAVIIPKINKKVHFLTKKVGKWHYYLTKQKSGDFYWLGDLICERWAGCIPLELTDEGKKKALTKALDLLCNGEIVGIFPEGKRSDDGKLLQGRTGVARLALWMDSLRKPVPVIPIGIKNTDKVWSRYERFPKFKKEIEITIGKPLCYDRYFDVKITRKLLRKLTDDIMKEIAKLCRV